MRVLLRLQVIQWVLLALFARVASAAYVSFGLNQSAITAAPYLTITIAFFCLWANQIIKSKRSVTIRAGDRVARIQGNTLLMETFKGKNLQNALGVDSFKAIQISPRFFNGLQKCFPSKELSLDAAKIVKKKGSKENTRFLNINNRFYSIPDSETQMALVGFNGNTRAVDVDKKQIDKNVAEELLSVKRWSAFPSKEPVSRSKKRPAKSKR